tara:strand:+ start:118 stop:489 length:372 start_codon:yes stop_codon:yes gene_type:complete
MMTIGGSPQRHVARDMDGEAGKPDAVFTVNPDAVDCPLGDGLALFDPRNGASFTLNRTGALIWNRARRPVTLPELRAMLNAACKGTPDDIDADLRAIVNALVECRLFITVSGAGTEAGTANAA